jgi:predicted ester cyclase
MSPESRDTTPATRNEAAFRQIIEEGFSQGNLSALDAVVAPDFLEHQHGSGLPPGLDGLKAMIRGLRAVLPDLTLTVEDLTVDGDKLWARLIGRGTHRDLFFGLPRTGKTVTVDIMDVARFVDGKIVEHWGVPDRFSLLEQLDVLPKPRGPQRRDDPPPSVIPAP